MALVSSDRQYNFKRIIKTRRILEDLIRFQNVVTQYLEHLVGFIYKQLLKYDSETGKVKDYRIQLR